MIFKLILYQKIVDSVTNIWLSKIVSLDTIFVTWCNNYSQPITSSIAIRLINMTNSLQQLKNIELETMLI